MFLIQNVNTVECRSILSYCLLSDEPYKRSGIEDVGEYQDCVPVGSVEFVEAYMGAHGISRPMFSCYPAYVREKQFYKRDIVSGKKIPQEGVFIKPMATKLFTGFVYPETDEENLNEFLSLPDETDCWLSEPVKFVSEYRYYVQDFRIIGWARYDDGPDEAPKPEAGFVFDAISRIAPATCAVDIGVLENGASAIVEINDAWAIGLYGQALRPTKYAQFLKKGWERINEQSKRIGLSVSGNC